MKEQMGITGSLEDLTYRELEMFMMYADYIASGYGANKTVKDDSDSSSSASSSSVSTKGSGSSSKNDDDEAHSKTD